MQVTRESEQSLSETKQLYSNCGREPIDHGMNTSECAQRLIRCRCTALQLHESTPQGLDLRGARVASILIRMFGIRKRANEAGNECGKAHIGTRAQKAGEGGGRMGAEVKQTRTIFVGG